MAELVELGDDLKVYTRSVPEAQYVYDEIFRQGCYATFDLPPGPLIVDAGANIGMFVIYMKSRYPDAELICFEPMPESVEVFRKNMQLHGIGNVTLHEFALGSRAEASVPFSYYPMLPANSTRHPEIKEVAKEHMAAWLERDVVEQFYKPQQVEVTVERLARFLPEDRTVDLLKVDVEGAEADVLLGVEAAQWANIQRVVVEVADIDDQLDKVCDILRENGFEIVPASATGDAEQSDLVHAVRA